MDNYLHNLIHQLSEDLDSLWRYDTYKDDSKNFCDHCHGLWDKMRKMDEDKAQLLIDELLMHVKEGKVKIK
ncbi:MAG: hypothetical protein HYV52_02245 [Parcubacteria group bacterium]|nr:hypothetical protein [Parcubacteria group bacterium]